MVLSTKLLRYLPSLIGLLALIILLFLLIKMFNTKPQISQHKKIIQQITLITPPPSPPPSEKKPEIQQPEEQRMVEKLDEAMPNEKIAKDSSNDLGIDAKGSAGGDSFGLVARKGGRGIVGGGYGGLVVQEINAILVDDESLRHKAYVVILKLWLGKNGHIKRYKIDKKSGDKKVDSMIASALTRMGTISEGPPLEMPQPIRLRIKSRI